MTASSLSSLLPSRRETEIERRRDRETHPSSPSKQLKAQDSLQWDQLRSHGHFWPNPCSPRMGRSDWLCLGHVISLGWGSLGRNKGVTGGQIVIPVPWSSFFLGEGWRETGGGSTACMAGADGACRPTHPCIAPTSLYL